jgi:hypothetical protein
MIRTKVECTVVKGDWLEVSELPRGSVRVSVLGHWGATGVYLDLKKTKQLVLALNNAILAMEEKL